MRQNKGVPPTAMLALTFALFAIAGCGGGSATGRARDTVRVQLFSEPVGELDNESASAAPTHLGGPFGDGVEAEYGGHTLPLSTVPLDEKMNDADLVAYLNKLIYDLNVENGQLILAPCTKNGNACNSGEAAPMYIQPEVAMNQFDVNTIDANGVIVARLINYDVDGRSARGFHVPASSRAWWVVRRNSKNQLESLFIGRDFSKPGQIKVKKLRAADFYGCPDHQPDPSRPSMARWWDCGGSVRFAPRMRVRAPSRSTTASAGAYLRFVSNRIGLLPTAVAAGDTTLRDDSTWITCSLGCCVAQ